VTLTDDAVRGAWRANVRFRARAVRESRVPALSGLYSRTCEARIGAHDLRANPIAKELERFLNHGSQYF
jgi:hypothetical protein